MRGHLTLADVDTFSFEVPEGGARYRLQVFGPGEGLAHVSVTTRAGQVIETVAAAGGRARIDEQSLPAGAYLVRIEGRDTEYALRLLDLGAVVEPPPALVARTDDDEAEPIEVTAPRAAPASTPSFPVEPAADTCATPVASDGDPEMMTVTYGDAARLDCGAHLNTVIDGDAIALDPEAAAFRYIWVAASLRGTVIKIDTDTGEVLGEYWTAPVYDPERPSQDPSRTVVDRNGNVWVGNRRDEAEGMGSVTKLGLLENGQCVDVNGNGVIDTSTGLGDVLGWDDAGAADRMGGVTTARDECVLQYVRVHSGGVRHVSVDGDGNVWVSGTANRHLDLLDGTTGEILRTEVAPCGGYGGLVDRSGVLWSARPLLRWDPSEPLSRDACLDGNTYGIGLDYDDRPWISDFGSSVCRFSRAGEQEVCYDAGAGVGSSRGVAVSFDNHVWVAHTSGGAVTRFAPDGTIVARIPVAGGPTGVSIDARGKPSGRLQRGPAHRSRIERGRPHRRSR